MKVTLPLLALLTLTLFLSIPARAADLNKIQVTSSVIRVDHEVMYEENDRRWKIYDAVFNPERTHILISRESTGSNGSTRRDFKVILVEVSPKGVLSSRMCRLDRNPDFEHLGMIEAYWADDRRVAARTDKPDPENSKIYSTGKARTGTRYFTVVDP
jgi:hypothetical protein